MGACAAVEFAKEGADVVCVSKGRKDAATGKITNVDMVNAGTSPEVEPEEPEETEEPERLAFGWDRPDRHYRKKSLKDE